MGYEIFLEIGDCGCCDVFVFVFEIVVFVYDKGDWVGDIDVLLVGGKWVVCLFIWFCFY